jgi:hypothetical protein
MPRVNRDLQRRMAARRERERRRPASGERRYRFASASSEPEVAEPSETELNGSDTGVVDPIEAAPAAAAKSARPTPRAFGDYRSEYAYVAADLRRVALVIGSLLLVLIVLYFILPH